MKRSLLCLAGVLGALIALAAPARALQISPDSSLIISEIKVKNDTAGYNEFIELYNAGITSLNLNDFSIEYFSTPAPAATDQPSKKAVVADGMLLPTQTIVLATVPSQIPGSLQSPFSSLADSGGLVRIVDASDMAQDQVAWTSTSAIAISPVLFLSSSTSNKTKSFTRDADDQGNPIIANPTWQLLTPSPHADTLLPIPKTEPDPDPAAPAQTNDQVASAPDNSSTGQQSNQSLSPDSGAAALPIQISELLPNPAPPASDSTDEYVELYNPNDTSVDLSGFRLQTGNTYAYSYTFPDSSNLNSHEYKAFYVKNTGALLANSGSRARLLDQSGQVIFETTPYADAPEGQAWAYINGGWQWTTTPSPDAANILTSPEAQPDKTASAKSTKSKTAASKGSVKSTGKTAGAKTTSSKKTAKTNKSSSGTGTGDPVEAVSAIHTGVVAGVGLLALAYAAYEYRYDVANRIYQLRKYREARAAARAKP